VQAVSADIQPRRCTARRALTRVASLLGAFELRSPHSPMHMSRAALALFLAVFFAGAPVLAAQDSTHAVVLPPFDLHGFVDLYYRAGDPTNKDGFRVRKADVKLSGSVSKHMKWRVSFDGAKSLGVTSTVGTRTDSSAVAAVSVDQKTRILQDAAVTYIVSPTMNVDVGQQVLPYGLEGSEGLPQVETIERTNFAADKSRAVNLGDTRDIGASVNGRALRQLEYHLGVYNETGDDQGSTDPNDQKAFIGRIVLHPSLVPNFEIGGTGAYEGGSPVQHRERGGTEAQYKTRLFTLRGETMAARDGLLHRFGWYGLGALRPNNRIELVARYDSWDHDRTHESVQSDAYERQIVVGGNYFIDGPRTKLALNIIRQTFPNISSVRPSTFLLMAFSGAW
jgi:hypothetical protein